MNDHVKVFVGTDPNMRKAEIALEWSIRKLCSVPVTIEWMNDARGGIWGGWNIGREQGLPYSPQGWATDFTCFRFAIPEANHFEGRAIYLDVDMILLRDIKEMFDAPMDRPVMATPRGYDVLLFDTSAFKDKEWWPSLEEMKKNQWNIPQYHHLFVEHDILSKKLSKDWNCCDGKGYNPNTTGLVHYTDMNTQPWKPYPKSFKYPEHPRKDMVDLWWNLYHEALENGYEAPSD